MDTLRKWVSPATASRLIASLEGGEKGGKGVGATARKLPRGRDAKLVAVEGKLVSWIQERIAAGHRVTTRMARVRAGRFAEEMDCVHVCKFSSTWLRAFMRRNGLSLRRRTRKKNQAIEDVLEVEARFQASMRRFEGVPPERRFNFDQVPLPLMCCGSSRRTIANRGAKEVWVRR